MISRNWCRYHKQCKIWFDDNIFLLSAGIPFPTCENVFLKLSQSQEFVEERTNSQVLAGKAQLFENLKFNK